MRLKNLIVLGVILFISMTQSAMFATSENKNPPPITVVSASELPELNAAFHSMKNGWIGADSAYSILLSPNRTLWLFGDTFVGVIEGNKRSNFTIIHNSAAWQNLFDKKPDLKFFWNAKNPQPQALLSAGGDKSHYYWPGDGVLVDGKLYLFYRQMKPRDNESDWFNFEAVGTDLLKVENPNDPPTSWQVERAHLPDPIVQHGAACLFLNDYLYFYGVNPWNMSQIFTTPMTLCRISKADLQKLNLSGLEYWSTKNNKFFWGKDVNQKALLFDGASEMSVKKIEGIDGFIAVYIPCLDDKIVLRHAYQPEGPWSDPILIHRCPEASKTLIVYSAKAHPELTNKPGEFVVTYSKNMEKLSDHVKQPDVYFPNALSVKISNP